MENFRTFSQFGEKGKFIVSGGNDKCIKLWNCSGVPDAGDAGRNNSLLHLNINLSKKVGFYRHFHIHDPYCYSCFHQLFPNLVIQFSAGELAMYHSI